MSPKILHLDLDAFFCAVEERLDRSLQGKPFAVGGQPQARGVVASCSYAARTYGVRSAMPMARALRLCPELIIVPARHRVYSTVSQEVMQRLSALSETVEQISIDEAFLDVSDNPKPGEALARQLQATIREELELPCSLGVATNKLVAKIATDVGKAAARQAGPPNAITVVPAGQEAAFLAPLPVEALWGVGPKTAAQLSHLAIHTIGDLARWPEADLAQRFGKHGHDLARRARGIDQRPLVTERLAKSVSKETTFARDVRELPVLMRTLGQLSEGVSRALRRKGRMGTTIRLKIRWPDFTTPTRQLTLDLPTDRSDEILAAAETLLRTVWQPGRSVRLIGVGVSNLVDPVRQLTLWETLTENETSVGSEKERRLQQTLLALQERYGARVIRRGGDEDPLD